MSLGRSRQRSSLPDWWTVDSTPGTESLTLASGALADDFAPILLVTNGDAESIFYLDSSGSLDVQLRALGSVISFGVDGAGHYILNQAGETTISNTGGSLGFFGAAAIARPAGVAVSAPGIHAALVSLGLITA